MHYYSFIRKNFQVNFLIRIILVLSPIPILYILLSRFGYVIPLTDIPAVLCIGGCQSQLAFHTPLQENQILNYNQELNKLINEPIDKSKTSILIEKSQHRLTVFYNKKPIKSYPVVFGENFREDKLHEGDYRTPEGILRIKDLYPHPQWSKFLWLDYPNAASWKKHLQEKTQGYINFFLPIGGEVGIHGVPQGKDEIIDKRENWTWGCPSLKNRDVDEIYEVVQKGTLVEILP
jgi:murein L,D-transpeptidase YafK